MPTKEPRGGGEPIAGDGAQSIDEVAIGEGVGLALEGMGLMAVLLDAPSGWVTEVSDVILLVLDTIDADDDAEGLLEFVLRDDADLAEVFVQPIRGAFEVVV